MMVQPTLQDRLREAIQDYRRQQKSRQATTQTRMAEVEKRLKHASFLVRDWMGRVVLPKLEMLATSFANALPVASDAEHDCALLTLRPTEYSPVEARVFVSLAPDPPVQNVKATFEVLMLPTLSDDRCGGEAEFWIESADTRALEDFLDDRIMQFVRAYLSTREPESPYQEARQVLDPVCGMRFPKAEAMATVDYGGRTYYFCIPACAEKFRARPERYLRP